MKIDILAGNCIERLAELKTNSIGAIISDPPYGLKFMNKAFDDLGDGSQQREWHKQWLTQALRVLKPNGIIKAFSGSRTYHHLAKAMMELGFEDVSIEAWAYGCLSADSEILTTDGWKKHDELELGMLVLACDPDKNEYFFQPIENVIRMNYKGDAYKIVSKSGQTEVEQLLSKNHKVPYIEQGKTVVRMVEDLYNDEDVHTIMIPLTYSPTEVSWIGKHACFEKHELITEFPVDPESVPLGKLVNTEGVLAQIQKTRHIGIMWCVQVESGFFVARRGGQPFVTGNSGFPKSMNLSKKFDQLHKKETGEIGDVIGFTKGVGGENMNDIVAGRDVRQTTDEGGKGVGAYGTGAKQVPVDVPVRELVSEEARLWQGWGTNLKPAFEPVVVGRKPAL